MNPEQTKRFNELRAALFRQIRAALALDGHCKSYEGQLEVLWPNYHEDNEADEGPRCIVLKCYVLGNGRQHVFDGTTFDECLDKMESFCADETLELGVIDVPALPERGTE